MSLIFSKKKIERASSGACTEKELLLSIFISYLAESRFFDSCKVKKKKRMLHKSAKHAVIAQNTDLISLSSH